MASRGDHLFKGDRAFATGEGWLARLIAPAFKPVIDRLDERLARGGIHGTLPDGTRREVGFNAPGHVATVQLHSYMALVRLALAGSVGWYKAWERGEWSSPDPVPLCALFMDNALSLGDTARAKGPMRWLNALAHRMRDNGIVKARENIAAHYDLGNDFYAQWLDQTMSYSAAMFKEGDSLEDAQERKIAALLDRLDLKEGDRLLEIGCGWGSLAIAAARRGASVVGLTLSTEQKAWAEAKIAAAGLADRIEIRLQDYRECDEAFDAIASVEMVEAVGERWWPAYLDCIRRNLKPGGKAALQFISIDHRLFPAYRESADFIQAYIFPGGMLLDEPGFEKLAAERGLAWTDRHGFGHDYAETLRIWRERYDTAVESGGLDGFSGRFHDLWRFYLMYCEGGFRGRGIDVAQVTLEG
ncbi:SAM-dependent methyltransferase [Sphingomicrobium arenosum]|uniref:SAM-dependent methyltransferase n=1 Tax=Sphingomicrobium arenosum TaxID=2233861 RepID=UPI0022400E61|nr:cyclopropane-fatty-acyl-phospholipid synthase family protein [Sphingomicrobium arenosum]